MTLPQRICLNMIVKDEAEVIQRSLQQLRRFIDYWVIVDTGSSDGTQALVKKELDGIPGELHERPWRNFGHNRSEAISLAAGKGDYLLFFDADDLLLSADFDLPSLSADAYYATFVEGDVEYERIVLVSTRLPWRYEGVIHAYVTPDCPFSQASLAGFRVESRRDGARGKLDPKQKYLRNAEILRNALADRPADTRSAFYLATSLQDAGEHVLALDAFARRIQMGGWEEEVWYSLLQVAILREKMNAPVDEVVASYLRAHEYRPRRAEALVALSRYLRINKRWELARIFSSRATELPKPADRLFLDLSCYEWRGLDEFAVASYWIGDYRAAIAANNTLLAKPSLPGTQRERIAGNLRLSEEKLSRGRAG